MGEKIGPAPGTGPFRCPGCGSISGGGLKYCPECGEKLTIKCPGCGGTWRFYYYYPYCPECGTKTNQRPIEVTR